MRNFYAESAYRKFLFSLLRYPYNDVRSWLTLLESMDNFRRPAGQAANFRVAQ